VIKAYRTWLNFGDTRSGVNSIGKKLIMVAKRMRRMCLGLSVGKRKVKASMKWYSPATTTMLVATILVSSTANSMMINQLAGADLNPMSG